MLVNVRLDQFNNSWFQPGSTIRRVAWLGVNRLFFQTSVPWPSAFKRVVLRKFGATIGGGVVIKNCITIKYPWNLKIGEHTWIGEGVWIDSLAPVIIGSHVCISQGCMIETGNHDWSISSFDLKLGEVRIDDGAWAAVKSMLLPGSHLAEHAVLGAGAVLSGSSEPRSVLTGNPAKKTGTRTVREPECK